jgi:hypothetical protein
LRKWRNLENAPGYQDVHDADSLHFEFSLWLDLTPEFSLWLDLTSLRIKSLIIDGFLFSISKTKFLLNTGTNVVHAGVSKFFYNRRYFLNFRRYLKN